MLDQDLLVHLAKHGMEKEVGEYLNGLGCLAHEPRFNPLNEPPVTELPSEKDYIIGCNLDPGIEIDNLINSRGHLRLPIPELTVFYRSGGKRIFVGKQVDEYLPAVEKWCEWFSSDGRTRRLPPEMPEQLR